GLSCVSGVECRDHANDVARCPPAVKQPNSSRCGSHIPTPSGGPPSVCLPPPPLLFGRKESTRHYARRYALHAARRTREYGEHASRYKPQHGQRRLGSGES
ncbi:MAG: hypothetical protein ACK559_00415, partial [bacterium]